MLGSSSVLTLGLSSLPFAFPGVSGSRKPDSTASGLDTIFFEQGLANEYLKFIRCGNKVIPFKCLDCELEFYLPYSCDLRICPRCSKRLASRFRARYTPIIKQYLGKKGKDRLALLTLTTVNKGEMPTREEIRAHNKAIGKLVKRLFRGAVVVNELKGTFLHSHAIIYGGYHSKRKIGKIWEELTGCSNVWITQVKGPARSVIAYISKYLLKPYTYENTQEGLTKAVGFLKAFKGVRRIHSFGLFYSAVKNLEKKRFECPYCQGTNVIIDKDKYDLGWTVTEARIRGQPSYQDIRNTWNNRAMARA